MKRAVLLGVPLALALATPAWAENQVVVGRDTLDWDRSNVAIAPGDSVTWTFPGTVQVHNVAGNGPAASDANWDAFASPFGAPAPDATYTFQSEGTYNFVCEVHPSTMFGTVTVSVAPVATPEPTPVPLSQQPYTNDDATPVVVEKVVMDRARPQLTAVSARRVARGMARVRFRVSELSTVSVRFKRGGRTVRTVASVADGLRGVNVRMRRGRYSVEVRATDVAGNLSAIRRTRITVR